MVSFKDAVNSALNTEFEFTLTGYELLELHSILVHYPSDHFRIFSGKLLDEFHHRVACLNSLPFDDVDEIDVDLSNVKSSPYPDDVPFPFEAKKYGK